MFFLVLLKVFRVFLSGFIRFLIGFYRVSSVFPGLA